MAITVAVKEKKRSKKSQRYFSFDRSKSFFEPCQQKSVKLGLISPNCRERNASDVKGDAVPLKIEITKKKLFTEKNSSEDIKTGLIKTRFFSELEK